MVTVEIQLRVYEVLKAHGHYPVGSIRVGLDGSTVMRQAVRAGVLAPLPEHDVKSVISAEVVDESEKPSVRVRKMRTTRELKVDGTPSL